MVTAQEVKELRERTGVGMMDCKRALVEANGDMEEAIKILREKGLAAAAKKAGRIAAEGIVESYIHLNGKIGVMVEVNCETDFVAKTPDFKAFVHSIAMHIAAAKPLYVTKEEVPQAEIDAEKEIIRAQALNEGKPEKIVDKIVEGRISKFYKEVCLMEQQYILDTDTTIRRFVRYEMGEGLEKRQDNFAEEVMGQIK